MTNDIKIEQYQDIIDKLHSGYKLNEEEKNIVETDPAFLNYQKEFSLIERAISHNALENKLSELNKLEEKYADNTVKSRSFTRRLFLALAAASILIVAFYIFTSNEIFDADSFAFNANIPFSDPDSTRGENNDPSDDPYSLYNNKEYGLALTGFEKLISTDDDPKHKFFLGATFLNLKKWKDAEETFENPQLKKLKGYPLNYNLAVSKLGVGKINEAIQLLENPNSNNALYNQNAKKIIEELKKYKFSNE